MNLLRVVVVHGALLCKARERLYPCCKLRDAYAHGLSFG
jgi:hypothetical protein